MSGLWWVLLAVSFLGNVFLVFQLARLLDEVDLLRRVNRKDVD